EDIVEKAESLKYFGGTYGSNTLPTPFLSLLLKMLQLQPDKDIINEFLNCEDMKYLQALAAFYIRLTANSQDIYELLEPFLSDFRKLRYFDSEKSMVFVYFDDFIDNLIREERFCGISMPVIQ
ncbi:MAG: Pre-mRNA-splicing factor 38A, partial [Paramarteilia canceri]